MNTKITLDADDFRALVAGRSVLCDGAAVRTVDVSIVLADIGFGVMLSAIADATVAAWSAADLKKGGSNGEH